MKKIILCFSLALLNMVVLFYGCRKEDPHTGGGEADYPIVTSEVSGILDQAAFCGGTIDPGLSGKVVERGVCWALHTAPTISDQKTSDGEGSGSFTSFLNGLQPGHTYYARAYATMLNGTHYGNEVTFNTLPPLTRVQQALILYYTSTGCSPCGYAGAPTIEAATKNPLVNVITLHGGNSTLGSTWLYIGFYYDRPVDMIPLYWIGDALIHTTDVLSYTAMCLSPTPSAMINLSADRSGDSVHIDGLLRFYPPSGSSYFLSYYLLEDSIPPGEGTYQAGVPDPFSFNHNHIIRNCAMNKVYGEPVMPAPGEHELTLVRKSIAVNPAWNNKLYVMAVLWKYEPALSPRYRYVNSARTGYLGPG